MRHEDTSQPDGARLAPGASRQGAADRPLADEAYAQLRAVAATYLDNEADSHTLQPTALVNEAFVRMVERGRTEPSDREHFLAVAATAMRQILIDHARARGALKRGGDRCRVTLTGLASSDEGEIDVIELGDALEQLRALNERQAAVVELRYFAGLSVAACAGALGVSERTIEADWRMARAWLHAVLQRGHTP